MLVASSKVAMKGLGRGKKLLQHNTVDLSSGIQTPDRWILHGGCTYAQHTQSHTHTHTLTHTQTHTRILSGTSFSANKVYANITIANAWEKCIVLILLLIYLQN